MRSTRAHVYEDVNPDSTMKFKILIKGRTYIFIRLPLILVNFLMRTNLVPFASIQYF